MDKNLHNGVFDKWAAKHREMVTSKKREEIITLSQNRPSQNTVVTLRSAVKLNLELLEQQQQGLNTDIVLNCKDGFFEIHSCILMISSPVFFGFRLNFETAIVLDGGTSPPKLSDTDLTQFTLRDVATVLFLFYMGETMINMPGMCVSLNTPECQRKVLVDILENLGAVPADVLAGFPLGYDKHLVERQLMNFHGRYLRFGVYAAGAHSRGQRSSAQYYLISVEGNIFSVPGLHGKIQYKDHAPIKSNPSDQILTASVKGSENKSLHNELKIRLTKHNSESDDLDCSLQEEQTKTQTIEQCTRVDGVCDYSIDCALNPNSETDSVFKLSLTEDISMSVSSSDIPDHPDGRNTPNQELERRLRSDSPMKPGSKTASPVLGASNLESENIVAPLSSLVQPEHCDSAATASIVFPRITSSSKRPFRITALQAQASIRNIIEVFPDKPPKKYRRRFARRSLVR